MISHHVRMILYTLLGTTIGQFILLLMEQPLECDPVVYYASISVGYILGAHSENRRPKKKGETGE